MQSDGPFAGLFARDRPCEVHRRLSGPAGAPVVVLSPSLGTNLSMWERQADALALRLRVLCYDLRGHGRSPVPSGPYSVASLGEDLLALLDDCEIERASLCGVSIGAMASMWVAARVPERIERLIVCCSSAHPDPTGAYRARAATVRTRGVERIADTVVARWFTPRFLSTSPRVVERMRRGLVATPREGYSGCCEAIAAVDLRAELPLIKASTLVIAGREDLATPPEHGYLIAERVEHARLELIPHAAHLANVEHPELVAKLMLRHLQ